MIDVSHAFCHIMVDPKDYNLLGLHWQKTFFDTCIPLGSRHRCSIFHSLSNVVHFKMKHNRFDIVNYTMKYTVVMTSVLGEKQPRKSHYLINNLRVYSC